MPIRIVFTGLVDKVSETITYLSENHRSELMMIGNREIESEQQGAFGSHTLLRENYGSIVEIHQSNYGKIMVGVYRKKQGLKFIEADRLVLTKDSGAFNPKIVSEYEVLWAAGIDMNERTFQPVIMANGETNISGVYYIE